MTDNETRDLMERIADALDRLAPPPASTTVPDDSDAFIWHAETGRLEPVAEINRLDIEQLVGSTGRATPCYRTPGVSPRDFRQTTRSSGAPAAWVKVLS